MENEILKIEMLRGKPLQGKQDTCHVVLKGNPVIIAKMIATAMDSRQDICAAVIAGVMSWCLENGINPDELKNMVKFHEHE